MYHAVSQGALAIEVRAEDQAAIELCRKISHWETAWTCTAERACLRVLEGGCSVPVGVASELVQGENTHVLKLTGCVTSMDGRSHVEYTLEDKVESLDDAEGKGVKLAKILLEAGAKGILDEIKADRQRKMAMQ